jgi:methyl-accepting chemotaxis protein
VFSEATSNIRRKIVAMGVLLALAPVVTLLAAGWIVMKRIDQVAVIDATRSSSTNLSYLTRNLFEICRSYQLSAVRKLKAGRTILDRAGPITVDPGRQLVWRAKNEITGEVVEPRLPLMMAGSAQFVPVADFNQTAPVVDEIERTYGTAATVFQRMNENGDMLRVSSSEKLDGGMRAIGSYIPAVSPDGHANQALQAVMTGQIFLGTTLASGTVYLAAYQPLKDEAGAMVGMLYTAVPEDEITARVKEIALGAKSPNHEELFVLRAAGDERGTALIMSDKSLEGHNLWEEKDSAGQLYVQEICRRAAALAPGDVAQFKYQKIARVGGIPRTVIVQFAYLPEWNWVVGFAEPEVNFLAGASAIQASASWGMWLLLGVGLAASGLVIRIWVEYSSDLTYGLSSHLADLTTKSKELTAAAGAISQEVHGAKPALAPSAAGNVLAKAGRTADEINLAIRLIGESGNSANGVIGSIEQMAFAINVLNTAAKAPRPEAGNREVAAITEKLRKLAQRCGEAARETKAAIEQSRIELQKGNEEVAKLVIDLTPLHRAASSSSENAGAALQHQTDNLLRLTEAVDRTLARMYKGLGGEGR